MVSVDIPASVADWFTDIPSTLILLITCSLISFEILNPFFAIFLF